MAGAARRIDPDYRRLLGETPGRDRDRSILDQWERDEATGTIDNFRIAAGLKIGGRRGFFYSDSDLHKWADAASRILRSGHSPRLEALLGEYVGLMARAQEPDGYLFTYNQIHFPGVRWKNLMIEHELYCIGHFIEAGVSRFEGSGNRDLLDLSERAADLIVENFREASNDRTSGHEEIEIALLRLYRTTRAREYLDTATALLERRGRIRFFGSSGSCSNSFPMRRVPRRSSGSGPRRRSGLRVLGENLGSASRPSSPCGPCRSFSAALISNRTGPSARRSSRGDTPSDGPIS